MKNICHERFLPEKDFGFKPNCFKKNPGASATFYHFRQIASIRKCKLGDIDVCAGIG
jgi:hypothetical protein